MPANHCVPHSEKAKARISAAKKGKPAKWRQRPHQEIDGVMHYRCGRCRSFLPREEEKEERDA